MSERDICFDTRTGDIVSIGRQAAWDARYEHCAVIGQGLAREGWDWNRALDPKEGAYRLEIRESLVRRYSRHPGNRS